MSSTDLRLEVGKAYRSRDGERVVITAKDDNPIRPFLDLIWCRYRPNGRFLPDEGLCRHDLVAEWVDEPAPAAQGPLARFDAAVATVNQDRGAVYGHPADNLARMGAIVDLFAHVDPPELRHAYTMLAAKLSRLAESPTHLDSLIDVAGYARVAVMVIEELGLPTK